MTPAPLPGYMGQEDSPARSPGTAGASPDEEVDEGYLSRLQPYVHRGTRSGAIAAVVGVGTLLRAVGSLVRRNWGRAVARLAVAAGWIAVAVLQRRGSRRRQPMPDRADVEAPVVPETEDDAGGETTIEIDEPGEETEVADEPVDEIGTGDDVDEEPVEPTSDELTLDDDEREVAVDEGDATAGEDEADEGGMDTDEDEEDDE